jgi:hypothetical protein
VNALFVGLPAHFSVVRGLDTGTGNRAFASSSASVHNVVPRSASGHAGLARIDLSGQLRDCTAC